MLAVKRILRYLKGTPEFGLWYPKRKNTTVTTYTNADWAGSMDDHKSTSGNAFFMGYFLVAWLNKKNHIYLSLQLKPNI